MKAFRLGKDSLKTFVAILMVSLLSTVALAQVSVIPADTRLYLQTLEASNNKTNARSGQRFLALQQKEAMSGTSMATPTAAGIIAVLLQANPELTYEQIKETIIATSNTDKFTEATPIRIYATDGRLVVSAPLMGGSVSLPAASPAGVYAVQVGTLGSTLIRK